MVGGFPGTPLAAAVDLRRKGKALEGLRVDFFLGSGKFFLPPGGLLPQQWQISAAVHRVADSDQSSRSPSRRSQFKFPATAAVYFRRVLCV
ncbi:unnamed protein product [Cuscuta campestris]|uniref:Uncharacterized protein n=1 Tax=Cuscuta campestris TaxID=132261 RepID=A0A484LW65_9ASTE|nr:unnamed protein product [Cuscuta campestris]